MSETSRTKSRRNVQAHRARLRAQGLRPVQIWVHDARSARFRRLAHRDALTIAQSRSDRTDQAFVDAVSIWPDEE
jgi:hypothetical protein